MSDAAIAEACARIAPAWPLDRLIAVNPYWGFVREPIAGADARLGALTGTSLLMPRTWYRAQWDAGRFTAEHVARARELAGVPTPVAELLAELDQPPPATTRRALVTDVVDADRRPGHQMAWTELVLRQISQACAACFDEGQATWGPDRSGGLYAVWRELAAHDASPRLLMGLRGYRAAVGALPRTPRALIAEALAALAVPAEAHPSYLTALLLSVGGWASACALPGWEARLGGRMPAASLGPDDDPVVHLLAVRLAWELVLYRLHPARRTAWRTASVAWAGTPAPARAAAWVLQRALELAYQEPLVRALVTGVAPRVTAPVAQVVFCIDVRSEVLRRALEATSPAIATLGFAGFFGLPIVYQPPVGAARPQLPGLLAPTLEVRDEGGDLATVRAQRRRLELGATVGELARTASSSLSFVELAGLMSLPALVRDGIGGFPATRDRLRPAGEPGESAGVPRLVGGGTAALAASILRAMSLGRGAARLVALIGHGASTVNNPQRAGLHCGACGGQTGEVNARALAALLNDPAIRGGLPAEGIELPEDTVFIAGLHDTTTDDVTLFELDRVRPSHRAEVARLEALLAMAGQRARAERAPALGIIATAPAAIDRAVRARARDGAEVRPEWGLARNAAFVVAPRERTRALDLAGRAFLHEYRWEDDPDHTVLELIMTAPMIVTHWINMQYYASTVDNLRHGSGNKVLHNVVGGRVGVLEGAGGDLRIGLAQQSLHDGERWIHEPLRLSVFIEAPAAAIEAVLAKHALVRDLVDHEWLFLFAIDAARGEVDLRHAGGWVPAGPARS